MKTIEEALSEEEAAFVREVVKNPGDHIPCRNGVWLTPEVLGLVKRIGEGKFVPTSKVRMEIFVDL